MARRWFALIGGMALVILAAWPLAVIRAQSSAPQSQVSGVTVSPAHKEIVIGPGLIEAKTTITIENKSGKDLVGTVRLVDFSALDEFGGVSLGEVGAPLSSYSLAAWMSLPNGSEISLLNGQTVTVPITIQNRDDLAPGGHYGAAIVSLAGQDDPASGEIGLRQEVASLVFVKKTGGETYGLELESLKADKLPAIPQSIAMKFKSTGNVHVVPRGYVEVTDPEGKLVGKGLINPESTLVLPNTSRQFVTIMQPVADAKAWGEYKITAYYRYDGTDEFKAHSLTFKRGIPFVSTGIILLVAVAITGVVTIFLRKKARTKTKKY